MLQKLIFIGHLGRDPEMRYTPAGQAVTHFSVAVNRRYTDADGQGIEATLWLRVSAWGRLAETCNQSLTKGQRVFVEGRLQVDPATGGPRTYTRQDGTPGAAFEVTATTVLFLSGRAAAGDEPESGAAAAAEAAPC